MNKTESEQLFERYLRSIGCEDWEFEPNIPGKRKRPDYMLRWSGRQVFFEVKELHSSEPLPLSATHINPYRGLRAKIHEARSKFREFKAYCCALVVCNIDNWEARLDPLTVYGAMLGNAGLRFDATREGQVLLSTAEPSFGGGGKMIDAKTGRPQNTTLSAIVVLTRHSVFDDAFKTEADQLVRQSEQKLGTKLHAGEIWGLRRELRSRRPESVREVVRVTVHENPYARVPFPEDLCRGDYDDRYSLVNGEPLQLFRGPSFGLVDDEKANSEEVECGI